jgi:cobalt-zinc-cadmium efflux system membrane fusion protein
MCGEHGVLEAVCTKCNPKLIPIFQAKGDWCAEHGFPESFCPICHPDKGGKPAVDLTEDGAPSDGMIVKLKTKEVAKQSGFETAKALPGGQAGTVIATATIVADNSKSALVNVRAPGVVRQYQVELGTWVDKGDPLVIIESASLAQERARLQSARARTAVAEANYSREKDLYDKGISAFKEVQAAQRELEEATADVSASYAAVEMAGAGAGQGGAYELLAPIKGVVTQRNFSVGTLVDQEAPIFEIVNTSTLWAEIDIPESQAGQVAVGQRVVLQVDGLPDREFEGVIQYVAPMIDTRTRTIRARASLDNRDGALRANMYARAHIFLYSLEAGALVPRAAVQEAKGVQLVFIRVAEDEYRARRVRAVPSDGNLVAVMEGLRVGEDVVTTGSFLLKTETLKGSIGAGCCDAVEKPN